MKSNQRAALVAAAILVGGCSQSADDAGGAGGASASSGTAIDGPAGPGAGGGSATLPCDVDAVLGGHCRACHSSPPAFGAPMPLVTYQDTQAPSVSDPSKRVFERIEARIHDDSAPMPQPPLPRLNDADTKTLDDWIAAGAPAGECSMGSGGAGGGIQQPELDCKPDIHLAPASPYDVTDSGDLYVCYGVDVPVASKRHVIAFAPRIDNSKIVHHVSLLQADVSVSPTPAPCPPVGSTGQWRSVYGWAPGVSSFEMPKEAGFPLEGTTHYVVQVHYSNPADLKGEKDSSGFDLCSTSMLRPNDADIMAFGTTSFTIPAHGSLDITCNIQVPYYGATTHLIAALPHMHKLGKTISTVAYPGGTGQPVDLGSVPNWDFSRQAWLPISDKLVPYDVVSTRCAWNNPGSKDVSFGVTTADEMCYSFTMYYPKITDPNWNWALPALYSVCGPTP